MTKPHQGPISSLYHCSKFKMSNKTKCWRGCGYTGLLHTATILESRQILITTLNIHVPHNIAIPHPDKYPQETLTFCARKYAPKCSLLHYEEDRHPETTQMLISKKREVHSGKFTQWHSNQPQWCSQPQANSTDELNNITWSRTKTPQY